MDLHLTMDKTWLRQAQLFLNFLVWAFASKLNELIWSFNSQDTVSESMATKLSDLDDQKIRVNLQTEGHTLTPPTSWNGFEDPEAFGSTP